MSSEARELQIVELAARRTWRRSWVLAVIWLALHAHTALADDSDVPPGQLTFRVFGAADGLHNVAITNLVQDRDGRLWIATEDGVYRFDGETFTQLTTKDGLPSSTVLVQAIGPGGEVCAGSKRGMACWDGARFSQAAARGLPAQSVQAMASAGGKLWVAIAGGGLYVRDAKTAFTQVAVPGSRSVQVLWADADGLVVGHGDTVALQTPDGAWRSLDSAGLAHEHVEGVLRDHAGAIWIRTRSHLHVLAKGAAQATDLSAGFPLGYVIDARIAMAIGPRGEVLIAADNGLNYRERDRWRAIDGSVGMPAAIVSTLFVDREGTIWIGASGLVQLAGRGLIEHYNVASGLPGEIVWTFARDPEGGLLAGTNRCLARGVAGRWACVPGTEGHSVASVAFPPQGGMFLAGAPSDLWYLDDNGRAMSFAEAGQPERHALSLALGPEGDLWIGARVGLYRLRGAVPGTLERVDVPGADPSAAFESLVVVGDQLWTAIAPGGVAVRDHGAWHVFGTADGLLDTAVTHIIARHDGRLCVAYGEAVGLTCFGYDGRTVTGLEHIGAADGLVSPLVYLLGEDRAHRLWIGTGAGLDVVSDHRIAHFDERDGLANNDASSAAFFQDRDGSLWFGSASGATHVRAQDYGAPPAAPRTAFVEGRLGTQSLQHGSSAAAVLEVPHDHSGLNLELGADTLVDPKRITYQVRLSPQESEWSTTHQREARYPALLPGSYQLAARSRIDAGPWGPISELRFAVLPAWWQTRWFLLGAALAGSLAVGGGFATMLRRRTRLLNAQSDASFRAVIDLMPELITVYRDGVLVYLNLASRRLLGIEGADQRWAQLALVGYVHPDDHPQVATMSARLIQLAPQQVSEITELRMRGADGSWRICEVSGVRVDIGGAPTVVTSGRDVTERRRMRAKMLITDRMASLGTLAAGIAHEINNPLAYVTGNLEVIAETLEDRVASRSDAGRDELTAAVSDARDGAERVRKIVLGLRSFTRSEEEQRVPLELAGVLDAAIRLTSSELRHRAQLVRESGAMPLVLGDDGRLTQVFINLLVNAAHAIPEGHSDHNRVTVRTRSDARGNAVIEIEDTGQGMTPEIQARVFDPFFTTKDVGEGTGLGLSICHGIISGLGGQIAIESPPEHRGETDARNAGDDAVATKPAGGTLVRVVLPAYASAAVTLAAVSAAPAPQANARRHRVLLVDDEPLVAQTMERLLRHDYDVTTALCGQDALAHIARGVRFDAIVSDVLMPNMTGIELSEELQRLAPDQAQRLIFLSGGVFTAQTRERLSQIGAPQLAKPIAAHDLRACVRRVATQADTGAA